MSGISFRPLEASDVEARVAQCTEKGCSLLLYKDARCDMRLLDDAVGPDGWQCDYSETKGNLYCRVGVWSDDRGEWVWKSDCGVPSNMEGEKGEASDAFKRACFKWGIGRELYTAPFVWVSNGMCEIRKNKQGRPACYDRFEVTNLGVDGGKITSLEIVNAKSRQVVFSTKRLPAPDPANDGLSAAKARLWSAVRAYAAKTGGDAKKMADGVSKRPDHAETAEFYARVAEEFETA